MMAFEMRDGCAVECGYAGRLRVERELRVDPVDPRIARYTVRILRAHELSAGPIDVTLYLPEGEQVTPEHLRAVERALAGR